MKKVPAGDDHENPKDVIESLKHSLIVVLLYSLIAVAIFTIGRFVWWVGFTFFAIFAAYALFELVAAGVLFVLFGLILRIVIRVVRARGLSPDKFDAMLESGKGFLWSTLVMSSVELYLVLITILLGISFFS